MDRTAGAPAFAGVDTHKDTHTLALLDGLRRPIGTWEFPTGPEGYALLEEAIGDPSVPVGVEGTCSYGKGLAEHLAARGYEVLEVVRPRREQRRRGKSDPLDAIAAAENVAAGKGLPPKDLTGPAGEVRWLMTAREHAVGEMTRSSNRLDSMLVTAPAAVRGAFAGLSGGRRIRAIASSRRPGACMRALRAIARNWMALADEAEALKAELTALLKEHYPNLLGAPGFGAISAARLVVAAGDNPRRMGSEGAFSMLCGTSPIPASTGKTAGRHRLNRGGDRQANRACHEVARVRKACDERTKAYIERKVAQGKSRAEATRCLCRYIAREAYRLLTSPQAPLPDARGLAGRRKELGLTQAQVAEGLGVAAAEVSRLEREVKFDRALLEAYESLIARVAAGGAPSNR